MNINRFVRLGTVTCLLSVVGTPVLAEPVESGDNTSLFSGGAFDFVSGDVEQIFVDGDEFIALGENASFSIGFNDVIPGGSTLLVQNPLADGSFGTVNFPGSSQGQLFTDNGVNQPGTTSFIGISGAAELALFSTGENVVSDIPIPADLTPDDDDSVAVPEPATLLGVLAVSGACLILRRRSPSV